MANEIIGIEIMIYGFIVLAIGLAVLDQYKKLKASFQKVKKENEPSQTESPRPQAVQECNCSCCCCCLRFRDKCICNCQCPACREYHKRSCGKHIHDKFRDSSD